MITEVTAEKPAAETGLVTLKEVRHDARVRIYITRANEQMQAIGYTEHGHRHAGIVSTIARTILTNLGHSEREGELAAIAGYLHDMGCVINRIGHVEAGALMAYTILTDMGMAAGEIATVIGAIGNHEEPNGLPISPVSAAVIIADKSDVHFSRVQEKDPVKWDIHDRVLRMVLCRRAADFLGCKFHLQINGVNL